MAQVNRVNKLRSQIQKVKTRQLNCTQEQQSLTMLNSGQSKNKTTHWQCVQCHNVVTTHITLSETPTCSNNHSSKPMIETTKGPSNRWSNWLHTLRDSRKSVQDMDEPRDHRLPVPMSRKTRAKIRNKKTAETQALHRYTDEDLALILNIWRHELGLPPIC